jgi:beta-phosphoglucomutase-like phosphatase (HAD superfamily)
MTEPALTSPASDRPATALVLDVDGTLLDTVYLHVIAWWEAFMDAGHEVSGFDIHRAIGRGSDDLVETLLGKSDERIVEGHAENWAPRREKCIPFHRVPDLIRTCADRGMKVVYCTSGAPEDIEDFRRKIGCDDVVSAVVNSSDVEKSKPAPDIVVAALEAVGVEPENAVWPASA